MVYQAQPRTVDWQPLAQFGFLLVAQLAAYWHAWQWYIIRIRFSPEEAFGFAAILCLLSYLALLSVKNKKQLYTISLLPFICLLLIYSLCHWLKLPAILRTGIAVVSIFLTFYLSLYGRRPPAAFWALTLLSLPLVPSLQFYLGYPARLISASLTVPLLQLNGLAVQREGTYLIWQSRMIQFDTPCSGIVMLWGGLFLTLVLAFLYRYNAWQTLVAVCIGSILVLLGNVLRAGSLFYLEAGIIPELTTGSIAGHWWHEGVGVIAFLITAGAIVVALTRFQLWLHPKIR